MLTLLARRCDVIRRRRMVGDAHWNPVHDEHPVPTADDVVLGLVGAVGSTDAVCQPY